ANNASMFQDTGDIDVRKTEAALLTGVFQFGKIQIDCRHEAHAALSTLTNEVVQVINSAGGIANYEVMLVTGGGAALIYDYLTAALPRAEFIMAEQQRPL